MIVSCVMYFSWEPSKETSNTNNKMNKEEENKKIQHIKLRSKERPETYFSFNKCVTRYICYVF